MYLLSSCCFTLWFYYLKRFHSGTTLRRKKSQKGVKERMKEIYCQDRLCWHRREETTITTKQTSWQPTWNLNPSTMQISRRLLLLLVVVGCMFLLLDEAKQKLFSACLPNNMPTGTHSLSFKRTQTMTTDKLNSPRVSSGDAPPPPAGKEEKRKRGKETFSLFACPCIASFLFFSKE